MYHLFQFMIQFCLHVVRVANYENIVGTLGDEAVRIWQAYQVRNNISNIIRAQ